MFKHKHINLLKIYLGNFFILIGILTLLTQIIDYLKIGEANEFYLLYYLVGRDYLKGNIVDWLWFPEKHIGLSVILFQVLYYIPTFIIPIFLGYLIKRRREAKDEN